jgi:hypothetical protein
MLKGSCQWWNVSPGETVLHLVTSQTAYQTVANSHLASQTAYQTGVNSRSRGSTFPTPCRHNLPQYRSSDANRNKSPAIHEWRKHFCLDEPDKDPWQEGRVLWSAVQERQPSRQTPEACSLNGFCRRSVIAQRGANSNGNQKLIFILKFWERWPNEDTFPVWTSYRCGAHAVTNASPSLQLTQWFWNCGARGAWKGGAEYFPTDKN